MKIRNSFVSNSSSSSFVVLLPDNFVENLDFSKYTDENEDFPVDKLKKALNRLANKGELWYEELSNLFDFDYSDMNNDDDDEYMYENLIVAFSEVLENYVICEMSTGPDEGIWAVANKTKIKEILKNEN